MARGSTPALPERRPLLGLLWLALGLLVLGSLVSSPPWTADPLLPWIPADACGMVGRVTADLFLGYLGLPLSIPIVAFLFAIGVRALFRRPRSPWWFLLWMAATAASFSIFAASAMPLEVWGRGPRDVAAFLGSSGALGPLGAVIVSGAVFAILWFLGVPRLLPSPLADWSLDIGQRGLERMAGAAAFLREHAAGGASLLIDRMRRSPNDETDLPARASQPKPRADEEASRPDLARAKPKRNSPAPVDEEEDEEPEDESADGATAGWEGPDPELASRAEMLRQLQGPRIAERPARERPAKPSRPVKSGNYTLPPLDLLDAPKPQVGTVTREEVLEKSKVLVQTLLDFGIEGRIGEVHPGPVITQYEYEPAAGVRISQVVSRADDVALALRAARIRMVAPIPGKGAIGIEVPNRQAEHIYFRSMVHEIDLGDAQLPLCLGRDIRGRPQFAQLEKMPHLLVAGTTGSGKSVCLNTCIFSLLYNRTPEDLRFLMVDPKMLELTVYDGIPHQLCPVVTDARIAARMLEWMVGEMERRYRKMAAFGVRNIEGYKEKLRDRKAGTEGLEPMPYIVVVVDELADLMLTLGREIETPIARLAQMARAVGIHLILATQRPSVDVITGVIKANFPARIAFQVASKVDSRTILDTNGAESLLGRGDMLYLAPGKGQPVRLHGAFVSDRDAESLTKYLKTQPMPEAIFREEMLDDESGTEEIDDELFVDALRLVVMQKQASVSFLQRRLKIGYSRAGRLMDLLERARAVGPHEGSKPREVIADDRFLHEWLEREKQREETGV